MEKLSRYIDHTLLKPEAPEQSFLQLCKEANEFDFFSVCLPSYYIQTARDILKKAKICTVVGFPLGYNLAKEKEVEISLKQGADEIDMVINISQFKSKNYRFVADEIKSLKKICGNKTLKVIIETSLLKKEEIEHATKLVIQSSADFIKTSTGFSHSGAQVDDVQMMKRIIDSEKSPLLIKASGGIKSKEDALKFIKAGASRLGTSSGVTICN